MEHSDFEHEHGCSGEHSMYDEILFHLPYSIFSVAFALMVLTLLGGVYMQNAPKQAIDQFDALFHCFHFLHIIFAATTNMFVFCKYSNNLFKGILIGSLSTMVFCGLSDMFLPYVAGNLIGVSMQFHFCFFTEFSNVFPFLVAGLLNGIILNKTCSSRFFYSIGLHFSHILVSSFAAVFYLASHGMFNWFSKIGIVFLFLIIAVIIPCTLSDIVVPITLAKADKKR